MFASLAPSGTERSRNLDFDDLSACPSFPFPLTGLKISFLAALNEFPAVSLLQMWRIKRKLQISPSRQQQKGDNKMMPRTRNLPGLVWIF